MKYVYTILILSLLSFTFEVQSASARSTAGFFARTRMALRAKGTTFCAGAAKLARRYAVPAAYATALTEICAVSFMHNDRIIEERKKKILREIELERSKDWIVKPTSSFQEYLNDEKHYFNNSAQITIPTYWGTISFRAELLYYLAEDSSQGFIQRETNLLRACVQLSDDQKVFIEACPEENCLYAKFSIFKAIDTQGNDITASLSAEELAAVRLIYNEIMKLKEMRDAKTKDIPNKYLITKNRVYGFASKKELKMIFAKTASSAPHNIPALFDALQELEARSEKDYSCVYSYMEDYRKAHSKPVYASINYSLQKSATVSKEFISHYVVAPVVNLFGKIKGLFS